jgi:4-hydroxybenzoyl-CoA thioesterase
MLSNIRTLRIEWGDCDPAGIIYYPRYFAIFDASTTHLMERAIGVSKIDYLKTYNLVGHPVVETRAVFHSSTRFGDEIAVETAVLSCGRSSVKIGHRISKSGVLAVEGFETRVFVGRDPLDPERIKSQPIPPEIAARLMQG